MQVIREIDCNLNRLATGCSVFLYTSGGCEDCAQNKKLDRKKIRHRKQLLALENMSKRNELTRALNKWDKERSIQILSDGYFIDVIKKDECLPLKSKYRDITSLDRDYFNKYGMTKRHIKLLDKYFNTTPKIPDGINILGQK
jgi:hypothetical protein